MNAFPSFDPQSEVWSHLEGGLQQARDELRALDPGVRDSVERIAAALGSTRGFLILPESKARRVASEIPLDKARDRYRDRGRGDLSSQRSA